MKTSHKLYKKTDAIYCFNRGRKKYNPQAAMAYIIYMMVGSAYNRSRICSTIVEERLRFEYMCADGNDYLVTFETFFGKLEFRIDRSGAAFQLRVDRK